MSARTEVVGPRLRRLLVFVFLLFAALTVNSLYLAGVTVTEWVTQSSLQNHFYLWMFLLHLVLGLVLIFPVLIYGLIHWRNAKSHRNRRAVKAGYALFGISMLVLVSGLTLTRGIPWVELKNPTLRTGSYWLHVTTPLIVAWLFVLHRLAGKKIQWRSGGYVLATATLLTIVAVAVQSQDPRKWNQSGPAAGEQYFFPSLARTTDGQFIGENALMMDAYCQECHADVHEKWAQSVHKFSSFNNPAYAFSVRKTRDFLRQRDGNVQAVRFCAGCHDPVPFFSGAMDDPSFGDHGEESAQAGITCSVCHSITHINSPRGNADFTIEEPLHYPFTFSEDDKLKWINRTLVKAKPAFHKQTFLKPLHQTSEFCGSCHKVHLPEKLNNYRWLRGQNHYDSFLLSGVSGHSVRSFYYPEKAQSNCNGCHMKPVASDDFGAQPRGQDSILSVSNHQFPAANTAIPHILDAPAWVNQAHTEALENSVRVDIVGLRQEGKIDGPFVFNALDQPLAVEPGKSYLIEVVIRTTGLGHHFTQGTADSNQIWLDTQLRGGDALSLHSGAITGPEKTVDPWAHFVNAFVLDAKGDRIDRRNPENIFTALYNNQIPPGAADVVHYLLHVPQDQADPIQLDVALQYRKFDNQYYQQFAQVSEFTNDLPITTMAQASLTLTVGNASDHSSGESALSPQLSWERWNDYGIGLFRRSQFRQAEEAFQKVESFGRGEGALNLARVYLAEGRLDDAAKALVRASEARNPAYPWSIEYFTAVLNYQNGFFIEAIDGFKKLAATQFPEALARGFDFSKDYRLLNELALALAELAKTKRGKSQQDAAVTLRQEALHWYQQVLALDPENVAAHYGAGQLHELLADPNQADHHRKQYAKYKPDDNAKDVAIQLARAKYPAADHAANKVVIIDLHQQIAGEH